jgi:hypothetical protein
MLLKLFVSYFIVVLIALQSVFAIADTSTAHQVNHQSIHQASDHHSKAELNELQTNEHNDTHPDCHQSHCHHGAIVYIEVGSLLLLETFNDKHRLTPKTLFLSNSASPDLRPPIV